MDILLTHYLVDSPRLSYYITLLGYFRGYFLLISCNHNHFYPSHSNSLDRLRDTLLGRVLEGNHTKEYLLLELEIWRANYNFLSLWHSEFHFAKGHSSLPSVSKLLDCGIKSGKEKLFLNYFAIQKHILAHVPDNLRCTFGVNIILSILIFVDRHRIFVLRLKCFNGFLFGREVVIWVLLP